MVVQPLGRDKRTVYQSGKINKRKHTGNGMDDKTPILVPRYRLDLGLGVIGLSPQRGMFRLPQIHLAFEKLEVFFILLLKEFLTFQHIRAE